MQVRRSQGCVVYGSRQRQVAAVATAAEVEGAHFQHRQSAIFSPSITTSLRTFGGGGHAHCREQSTEACEEQYTFCELIELELRGCVCDECDLGRKLRLAEVMCAGRVDFSWNVATCSRRVSYHTQRYQRTTHTPSQRRAAARCTHPRGFNLVRISWPKKKAKKGMTAPGAVADARRSAQHDHGRRWLARRVCHGRDSPLRSAGQSGC
jgi:hypothetical protein